MRTVLKPITASSFVFPVSCGRSALNIHSCRSSAKVSGEERGKLKDWVEAKTAVNRTRAAAAIEKEYLRGVEVSV
jgi:hypothetical protein